MYIFPRSHNFQCTHWGEIFYVFVLEYTNLEMLFEQVLFNTEPNKFYIYDFGLEKCSLMSIVLSFWNKV